MKDLAGKVAVVTGGGGGIGRAICRRFGQEGMKVVVADFDQANLDAAVAELREESFDVTGVYVDVTKLESVEAMRDATLDAYGAVHVLCNNAGIANSGVGQLWEHEDPDWRYSFDVHFFGVTHGCAAFIPTMLASGEECHIVNTVSSNGGISPMPTHTPYAVAKGAVMTYSECLWVQLRQIESKIGVSILYPSGYTPGLLNTGIWNQRVRPPEYQTVSERPMRRGLEIFTKQMEDAGREVAFTPLEEVADQVAVGIKNDQFWMLVEGEGTDERIRARADSLLGRKHPDYLL
jgi:NAD(P)-dependent dehydrogenase (short-subunit alcohol dehydrogenase family)